MERTLLTQAGDNANNKEIFNRVSPLKAGKTLRSTTLVTVLTAFLSLGLAGCGGDNNNNLNNLPGADGPVTSERPFVHEVGNDVENGKKVFRFETFGNEDFWTNAVQLQQGIIANKVTPIQALQLGLSVDIDALDTATVAALKADLLSEAKPLLNDPETTIKLINANAVIGIVAVDINGDGIFDVKSGIDKTGPSCALCHTITDGSTFNPPDGKGGSIGRRLDGRAAHNLNFGGLVAAANNSRVLYPMLQLTLDANGGKTLGRAPTGITVFSTETEVDAYLSNPDFYPVGMFDDTVDGNGDPMHNSPLFRTDLAAPWGTEGSIERLDNFSNLVYTVLFDPTTLTTLNGRAFLRKLGGTAAGDEIADTYVMILANPDPVFAVTGYPFVNASEVGQIPGSEAAPVGLRVDNQKLLDMNAYLNSLQAPPGVVANADSRARGRQLFRVNCTSCHNVDQSLPVPAFVVAMKSIFPGDIPVTLLATRDAPLNAILNTVDSFFDDKMAVVNASIRGDKRGTAMPLLLDLARKPNFLHDNSVPNLDALLNPSRGPNAPHPFYITDAGQRGDMIEFLRGLDTTNK